VDVVSNVGRWQSYYDARGPAPFAFDASPVFAIGAEWLAGCASVADWGCGGGWLSTLVGPDRYIGVDGSKTAAVTVVADLADYHGCSEGIFIRHVLEHDYRWSQILDNALEAFDKRMVLVLFTPWHDGDDDTVQLRWEAGFEVPTLAFRRDVIEARLERFVWDLVEVPSPAAYGLERVFLIER
jgi:hypothetical protein